MRWFWKYIIGPRIGREPAIEVVGELKVFEVLVRGQSYPEAFEARGAYVGGAGELVFSGTAASYTEAVMTLAAGEWRRYAEIAA